MAGGRPTDYKPEYCEVAVKLLNQGKSLAELCRHFKIARSTLGEWEKNHEEFSLAIKRGLTFSEAVWSEMSLENLQNKNFNSRLYELNMQNRFGWNKKTENTTTVYVRQEDALKELE